MSYGASSGAVRDPYGQVWVLLTQIVDSLPSPEETERLGREALMKG